MCVSSLGTTSAPKLQSHMLTSIIFVNGFFPLNYFSVAAAHILCAHCHKISIKNTHTHYNTLLYTKQSQSQRDIETHIEFLWLCSTNFTNLALHIKIEFNNKCICSVAIENFLVLCYVCVRIINRCYINFLVCELLNRLQLINDRAFSN